MAITLLHGFAGQPGTWAGVCPTGLALRLPGHGLHPVLPGGDFSGAVAEVASRLPPRGALVGYSMGARVALALAMAHPERVTSLLLIGVHAGLEDEDARRERRAWDEAQALQIEEHGVDTFMDGWEQLPLFETQQRLPASVRARLRRSRREHTAAGLAWAMRVLGLGAMPPQQRALAAGAVPVQLLCGALDAKFVAEAERIRQLAPRARVTVVPGVGHDVVTEAPRVVAEAIATLRR